MADRCNGKSAAATINIEEQIAKFLKVRINFEAKCIDTAAARVMHDIASKIIAMNVNIFAIKPNIARNAITIATDAMAIIAKKFPTTIKCSTNGPTSGDKNGSKADLNASFSARKMTTRSSEMNSWKRANPIRENDSENDSYRRLVSVSVLRMNSSKISPTSGRTRVLSPEKFFSSACEARSPFPEVFPSENVLPSSFFAPDFSPMGLSANADAMMMAFLIES